MDAIKGQSGAINAPKKQGSTQGKSVNISKMGKIFENEGAEKVFVKKTASNIAAENKLFLGELISPEHTGRWGMDYNSSDSFNVQSHLDKIKNSLNNLESQIKEKTIYIMTRDAIEVHQDRRTNNEWYRTETGGAFLHGIESQLEYLGHSITIPKKVYNAIETALSGKIEEAKEILNSQIIQIQEEN